MVTPEQLEGLPYSSIKLYRKLEDFILADISRRIAKAGYITDTAEWQILRLKELGEAADNIKKEIARITKISDVEVNQLFFDSAQISNSFYEDIYKANGTAFTPLAQNDYLLQLIEAGVKQTNDELHNFTQSMGFAVDVNGQTVFKPLAKVYQETLDFAQFQVSSGASDYITATRQAVKKLADSGIRFVDYKTGWVNRSDVAVRRATLTGIGQITGKISAQAAIDLDTDIVETTAHSGARPDHALWQGKWFSLSGKSTKYPSLEAVTGYGSGAGLKGWNCRHDFFAVVPGISKPAYSDEDLKNLDSPPFEYEGKTYTSYEATQQQRNIETAMRKSKRELIGFDASGDKDAFTTTSIKLRRQKDIYKDFSAKAGLPLQNERTQVIEFDRSIAQKAVSAQKQAVKYYASEHLDSVNSQTTLQNSDKSGIISKTLKFEKREDADNLLRPRTEELWAKLTPLEKTSAYEYTVSSGRFNRPLRGYDMDWGNFVGVGKVPLDNEDAEDWINGLKSAIDKSELQEDMWLFRGSDKQALAGLLGIDESKIIPSNVGKLNKKYTGQKINDTAFFSTGVAADAGFTDDIAYEIFTPRGTKGIYAEPFSYFGGTDTSGAWDGTRKPSSIKSEAEIILQAGTNFNVKGIELISGKITAIFEIIN